MNQYKYTKVWSEENGFIIYFFLENVTSNVFKLELLVGQKK